MILYRKKKKVVVLDHRNTSLSTNTEKIKKGLFFWLTSKVTEEPVKKFFLREKQARSVTCILQRRTTCSLRFLPPSRKLFSVRQLPSARFFPERTLSLSLLSFPEGGSKPLREGTERSRDERNLLALAPHTLPKEVRKRAFPTVPTEEAGSRNLAVTENKRRVPVKKVCSQPPFFSFGKKKGMKAKETAKQEQENLKAKKINHPSYEFKIAVKNRLIPTEYSLETYHRSNQDTCLLHNPAVFEGDWVQSGDLLADCAASSGGELSLGKNILIAYMPWEGYNFEDAILISERLVFEDVYSSIHIERYDIEIRETKYGMETITREIPELSKKELEHLDLNGIAKLGSWIQEGDILVGRVTPINKTIQSNYKNLLYTILEAKPESIRDSSLRAPRGMKGKIVNVQRFSDSEKAEELTLKKLKTKRNSLSNSPLLALFPSYPKANRKRKHSLFSQRLASSSIPVQPKEQGKPKRIRTPHLVNRSVDTSILPSSLISFPLLLPKEKPLRIAKQGKGSKPSGENTRNGISRDDQRQLTGKDDLSSPPDSSFPFAKEVKQTKKQVTGSGKSRNKGIITKLKKAPLKPSLITKKPINLVYVYLAEKRKIQVGDKMAGRHGNKGIVSQVLPRQDMPFLANGTPIDMVLNPLGVPSRMNVGQIYECLLGLAAQYLGEHYKIFPFDEKFGSEASRSFVYSKLYEARKKTGSDWLFDPNCPGKTRLFDGRTGEPFDQTVTVGYAYMLKLVHLVDDKIHMRSTGPYSLVTQQPLRGRSKQGGQRLGEMEVWALEGYGAAFTLLEMLTLKSDDMTGRMTLWSNLILNKDLSIGTPESFKVLVCELQALCLDIGIFRADSAGNLTDIESLKELP